MTENHEPLTGEVIDGLDDVDDPAACVPVPAVPTAMVPAAAAVDLVKLSEEIGRRVDATLNIRRHMMRLTHPTDWRIHERTDENGKAAPPTAYLESKGAQRLAATLGIGWTIDPAPAGVRKDILTDSQGRAYYQYVITGVVEWQGRRIPAQGGCSSRHKLLSRGGRIPSEDVIEIHVRKKAMTDFIRTGVCELLGMKDIPVSELPESYRTGIGVVTYQAGSDGGDVASDKDKAHRTEITRALIEMAGSKDAAIDMLAEVSSFTVQDEDGKDKLIPGVRETKLLVGKRLDAVLGKVRRLHEAWTAQATGSGTVTP